MLFVELGREVSPRNIELREEKAVITGIIDNRFVVIMKQDSTNEVVRVKDIVLNETVYSLEDLKSKSHAFYKKAEPKKISNDFDRFMLNLKKRIVADLLKSKGLSN